MAQESFYSDGTEVAVIAVSKWYVKGLDTCRSINFLLEKKVIKLFLKVGSRSYPVTRITPQSGDSMRVYMQGMRSIEVDKFTDFTCYLGGDFY